MEPTTVALHTDFEVAPVDPRLFGGFLEHLGRAVYGGVFEPGSPLADGDGFRTDVLRALGQLGFTAMRYPGGNFASGYHWQDGVGPPERRPAVLDLAWRSVETNRFGTDEFLRLCARLRWTGMLTVNLGTGTPEEARNWVEYCNAPAGTRYADLRAANGRAEPWGVPLWCLGNEMDGPWQLGHVSAQEYATSASQAAKMMKDVDPSIELAVCGSSGVGLPTYLEWDRAVLEGVGDLADYLSIHRYVGNPAGDTADYLAVPAAIDRQIEQADAVCRFAQARRRSNQRAFVCFDEWNVWYRNHDSDGGGRTAPALLEEVYNLEDALVVAGFLNSFLRHADAVKIANLAQVVNVIAPVLTRADGILLQSIYYPFEMYSRRREGVALRTVIRGPTYESRSHGTVACVDAAAVRNEDSLHVFLIHRGLSEPAPVTVAVSGRRPLRLESAEVLTGPDPKAVNTFDRPYAVASAFFKDVEVADGLVRATLPPLSVTAMSLQLSDPVCFRT